MASRWGAIAADVGASLLVVASDLRLLRATRLSFASGKRFDAMEAMVIDKRLMGTESGCRALPTEMSQAVRPEA